MNIHAIPIYVPEKKAIMKRLAFTILLLGWGHHRIC